MSITFTGAEVGAREKMGSIPPPEQSHNTALYGHYFSRWNHRNFRMWGPEINRVEDAQLYVM